MHSRLIEFLEERQILCYKQFGFQKYFLTNHAILNLLEIIQKAVDGGQIACGIFIDLEKAFDSVSHDILLEKLDHYGIKPVLYPAIFFWGGEGGCRFFDERSKEENHCAAGKFGATLQALPSGVQGRNPGNFWLFCLLNSSKHRCLGSGTRDFVDESLHQKSTLLSIWGFEFVIPNWYTGFKKALDMALEASQMTGSDPI